MYDVRPTHALYRFIIIRLLLSTWTHFVCNAMPLGVAMFIFPSRIIYFFLLFLLLLYSSFNMYECTAHAHMRLAYSKRRSEAANEPTPCDEELQTTTSISLSLFPYAIPCQRGRMAFKQQYNSQHNDFLQRQTNTEWEEANWTKQRQQQQKRISHAVAGPQQDCNFS